MSNSGLSFNSPSLERIYFEIGLEIAFGIMYACWKAISGKMNCNRYVKQHEFCCLHVREVRASLFEPLEDTCEIKCS